MKRRLFNAGAGVATVCLLLALAFLLSLAVGGFWRTYSLSRYSRGASGAREWHVKTYRGLVLIQLTTLADASSPSVEYSFNVSPAYGANKHLSLWRRYGIHWRAGPLDMPPATKDRVLTFQLWHVSVPLALLTWWSGHRWRAGRRALAISEVRCPACGYDLRGTPGSQCPECGAAREIGPA